MKSIDILIKMGAECSKSDTRINQIQYKVNSGEITPGEAIDLIDKETSRVREVIKRLQFDPVVEYGYMTQNAN